MCGEPGWNDTLHRARHADPSDSGIRNPDSSQRSMLARIMRRTGFLATRHEEVLALRKKAMIHGHEKSRRSP
jgi:hypothetical protein